MRILFELAVAGRDVPQWVCFIVRAIMSFTSPRHFSILWLVGTSPPGDFVQAYVIGHEVAHPVQNLLKLNEKFEQVQQGGDQSAVRLARVAG